MQHTCFYISLSISPIFRHFTWKKKSNNYQLHFTSPISTNAFPVVICVLRDYELVMGYVANECNSHVAFFWRKLVALKRTGLVALKRTGWYAEEVHASVLHRILVPNRTDDRVENSHSVVRSPRRHICSSRYDGRCRRVTPYRRLNVALHADHRASMLFVCTPVAGFTKWCEWLTVSWM